MKLNWLQILATGMVLSSLGSVFPSVLAQSFDYSLLVGEWSDPDMCGKKRYVYTADGEYMLLEKSADGSTWETLYEGIYVIKPEIELVVIAEKQDLDGFGFKTLELSDTTYTSSEDARTLTFQRCGDR